MSGTVNVARAIWDDPTFKDSEMSQREAWIWMIAEASWKDRIKRVGNAEIALKRGQLVASTRFLAKAWLWSEPRVRRYFEMLENRRMISRVTDAGVTVISICKYDDYQNTPRVDDAPATHHATQDRRTSDANDNKGEIRGKGKEEEPIGSLSADADPAHPIPVDEISLAVSAYRAAAADVGWPDVRSLSKQRRAALAARLREVGLQGWQDALARARGSPHLTGQNDRGWTASFDFLTRKSSFDRLMEGNYDPRPSFTTDHFRAARISSAGRNQQPSGLVGAALRSRAARAD